MPVGKSKKTENADDYKQKYLRALADYQNLLKRVEQEKQRIEQEVAFSFWQRFLDIYEDMLRADVFVKDQGLKMILDKMKKFLKDSGVSEVELEGKKFDPELAEVVDVVSCSDDQEDNTVSKVYRKAYKLFDKVLQVGKVQVKKKS
ncbi:MAG: hypothetical protein KatS3mg090_0226 [Patescibacteria group bacterium]|nr:MAG: hypothetical protein KatS3mg090_0226 [Patescibacteria group bacterium]